MASPSIEQFVEFLSQEPRWYTLGIFLGAPAHELREIERKYQEIMRCLSELYECLQRRGKSLSWERITSALEKMGNFGLAEKILHSVKSEAAMIIKLKQPEPSSVVLATDITSTALHYHSLIERFAIITVKIRKVFNDQQINAKEVLQLAKISGQCVLPSLEPALSIDTVFDAIEDQCTILNFRLLVFLAESLLVNVKGLLNQIEEFTADVEVFKYSAKMIEVAKLIESQRKVAYIGIWNSTVKLKVREFWSDLAIKQFETIMTEIFQTLYDIMTHITVTKGCICLTWIIPDIATELIPKLPLEFIRIIGVISLHIGSKEIYNIEGDGCETIEAAMLQAIELKNTQAIELLLAIGCSIDVATFNGDNAVTNIVNIRPAKDKESISRVDHVCILGGHEEHSMMEIAINLGSNIPVECSSCSKNKKMLKENKSLCDTISILRKRISFLHLVIKDKDSEIKNLKRTIKSVSTVNRGQKDAENTLLTKRINEKLITEETKTEMTYHGSTETTPTMVTSSESSSQPEPIRIQEIDSRPPKPAPRSATLKHSRREKIIPIRLPLTPPISGGRVVSHSPAGLAHYDTAGVKTSTDDDDSTGDSGHGTGSGFTDITPFWRRSVSAPSSPVLKLLPPKPQRSSTNYATLNMRSNEATTDHVYTGLQQTNHPVEQHQLAAEKTKSISSRLWSRSMERFNANISGATALIMTAGSKEPTVQCYTDILCKIGHRLTEPESKDIAALNNLEQRFQDGEEHPFSVLLELEKKQIISEARPECLVQLLDRIYRPDLAKKAKKLSDNLKRKTKAV